MTHLNFLVPTPRTVLSNWHADLLHASFTFIQKMYNISRRANIGATALCAAMQPLGVMRTITTILCTLGDSPASDIDTVLHNYVKFLGIIIHTPRMAVWIAEGLKHGLLRAILVCADRNSGGTSHTLLRDLLNETLNPSLIYDTVVAQMESALLGVNDLTRTSRFAKLPEWHNFVLVAEELISILKGLNAIKWASFKACDNIRARSFLNLWTVVLPLGRAARSGIDADAPDARDAGAHITAPVIASLSIGKTAATAISVPRILVSPSVSCRYPPGRDALNVQHRRIPRFSLARSRVHAYCPAPRLPQVHTGHRARAHILRRRIPRRAEFRDVLLPASARHCLKRAGRYS
jgi:hypothetical protein